MNAGCHSGRWSHTRGIIMEHGRSQEYCEVRSTAHRKDMDITIPIHQAAVKASTRSEYTITEGHLSQPSYSTVLHPTTKEWHVDKTIVTDNERMVRAHTFWISLFPTKSPNSLFGAKFWIQMQPNCSIVALCVLNDRHMYALTVAFILGCRIVNVADWVIRLYNAQQYTHMTLVEFSNPVQ